MVNDWNKLSKQGKDGENAALALLTRYQIKVRDVTDLEEYQKKDIDFLCENREGTKYSVEVKFDKRINRTGNLFLELVTTNAAGWWSITEADYLFYGDAYANCFYIIEVAALRDYLKDKDKIYRKITCPDYLNGKWIKNITGLLVPVADLLPTDFCRKVYTFKDNF